LVEFVSVFFLAQIDPIFMKRTTSQVMSLEEKRAAFSLASLFSLRMFGLFMVMPILSLYGSRLEHADPLLIGIAIGVYGLTQALFQIPFGFLSDRIGRNLSFMQVCFCLR
jgi:MFS family permease